MNDRVLHRFALSGHCHRVELMLSLLELPFRAVEIDLAQGEQKRPEFVAKNPFAKVPVLDDGDVTIADSNAILVYLARRYAENGPWLPRDPASAAEVQRWLSIASGPLAEGPAKARVIALFERPVDAEPARTLARELFARMNDHLADRAMLASATPTLADVAMYAYTAHAPEGGGSLAPYPHIRRWLERIQSLPRFVPMQATATRERESAT
ncbi:MAG: glutathione S-transferase family protein [Polyangiales bacterium]